MTVVKNSVIVFFLPLWVSEYISEEQKKSIIQGKGCYFRALPSLLPALLFSVFGLIVKKGSFITKLQGTNEKRRQHKVFKKFAHFFQIIRAPSLLSNV